MRSSVSDIMRCGDRAQCINLKQVQQKIQKDVQLSSAFQCQGDQELSIPDHFLLNLRLIDSSLSRSSRKLVTLSERQ